MALLQEKTSMEMENVKLAVREEVQKNSMGNKQDKGNSSYCCGLVKLNKGEGIKFFALKIAIWVFLVGTITFTPVMMKFSFYTNEGYTAQNKYAPPTVLTFSFLISIILGISLSAAFYGIKGIKDIFNIRAILLLAPVSFGYAGSEALALFAMRTADPILYAIIHKMRLLETAVMTRIFLRRQISLLQWVICFTVTACVLAFVMYTLNSNKSGKKDLLGPVLLIINITLSVACSIYADWSYKKVGYPLPVQIACGRITATIAASMIAITFISVKGWWKYGWFGGPEGGWDWRVITLMFYNILRDWTTCFVLLYLDALWKALAGSTAVATTYLVDVLLFGKKFVPTLICLVIAIMFAVSIYALSKQVETRVKTLDKKNAELTTKLRLLAGCPEVDTPISDATTA